jgi:putative thiamine transport system ATP-binding protein
VTHATRPAARRGLVLERVSATIGGRRLFELDLTVPPGVVATVMGPSGSGKSTLLALVGGFLGPEFTTAGSVSLDGADLTGVPAAARRLGLLFQDDLLFPHLSVGGNLAFGLPPEVTDRRAAVALALAETGMAGFENRDPASLSGGQRSRVALMRTLLAGPRALLLDEPFSRLDRELRGQIRRHVFDMARSRGLPVLLVSHDREDADDANGPILLL